MPPASPPPPIPAAFRCPQLWLHREDGAGHRAGQGRKMAPGNGWVRRRCPAHGRAGRRRPAQTGQRMKTAPGNGWVRRRCPAQGRAGQEDGAGHRTGGKTDLKGLSMQLAEGPTKSLAVDGGPRVRGLTPLVSLRDEDPTAFTKRLPVAQRHGRWRHGIISQMKTDDIIPSSFAGLRQLYDDALLAGGPRRCTAYASTFLSHSVFRLPVHRSRPTMGYYLGMYATE